MLFNSLSFLVFFPVVTLGYYLLPYKHRWWWLLAASCWFYMAFVPVYILILGFTIAVDYAAGILIDRNEGRKRKLWLVASIVANVGVLAFFKYFNFLNQSIGAVVRGAGLPYEVPELGILLPIGLSFHTFQSLSYTIEVYRKKQAPERRLGVFALYVMFYPQLVAGPIERPANLLRQLGMHFDPDYDRIAHGLRQMAWGFFKKLVIADRCGAIVDLVYSNPNQHDGWTALVATYLFAIQIYCDFSGYTDIAIGAARTMGFELMVNFRTPYMSGSISEFWGRWHISLSSWFRDYLYIPLGGNRVAVPRWYFNLFIVFLLSGLWHGADWTYVVWGALHGLYLIAAIVFKPFWSRIFGEMKVRWYRWLNVFFTFHLVLCGWVLFRAESIGHAKLIFSKWLGLNTAGRSLAHLVGELKPGVFVITVFFALLFFVIDPWVDKWIKREVRMPSRWFDLAFQAGLVVACLLFGFYGKTMFIYFQF
ncbi:MAG: MBOAT family O-acyltransferase [Flavobacteriales bacterium]